MISASGLKKLLNSLSVGKNKLAHWAEIDTFGNVIQPDIDESRIKDHHLKGKWNSEIFRNNHPVILELGCGKGEYTVGLAENHPGKNFIGVDIKGARMWRGAKTAFEKHIPNVRFLRTRIEFINSFFDKDEVDEIWLTFPDPHPRRKSVVKRLSGPAFLNLYRSFLKNRGIIHLKTDNHDLYRFSLSVAEQNELDILAATDDLYSSELVNDTLSIKTHYEKMFLAEGKKINYLSFRLNCDRTIEEKNT